MISESSGLVRTYIQWNLLRDTGSSFCLFWLFSSLYWPIIDIHYWVSIKYTASEVDLRTSWNDYHARTSEDPSVTLVVSDSVRPHRQQPTRLPPSLGFSRQEHRSGLPFPSPMHESEKWKRSRSVVSDSVRPHGLQPTRLLHPWGFPGKSTGVGCDLAYHLIQIQNLRTRETFLLVMRILRIYSLNRNCFCI